MRKLRIVFMGTPEFAVGILDSIIKHNFEIAAVITAPDKPAGRGQKVKYSAVKEFAVEHGLKILQPTNLKDEGFLSDLKSVNANLQVVVAFRMLPQAVWQMPEYGTFNLHASLLPDYRGAAPINWAIINGEQKTGVTTFFIDDKIDTGAIILNSETPIAENENAGQLHDRLKEIGAELVIDTLKLIETGTVSTTDQKEAAILKTANKLTKENTKIDWTKPVTEIYNHIRGLSPYPAAWFDLVDGDENYAVKIYEAGIELENHSVEIGKVIATKKEMRIAAIGGYLVIKNLQLPGKKRLAIHELLNGHQFSDEAKVAHPA